MLVPPGNPRALTEAFLDLRTPVRDRDGAHRRPPWSARRRLPESSGSAVRGVLVSRCHAASFTPRIAQTAPDSWTCVALVLAGVGLHLTTASAMAQLPLEGVSIREVADRLPPISVYLVWRSDDDDPALGHVLATADRVLPRRGHAG
ncbi:LysR substrate-binding domain-containing protein [Actinomycetospora rhizophila]|uniref:LysR substrate-binding domain-containing protein n=1 Tax=Actinomycetospora rhizophila TaxID=1416876 RepID=A0ABV9ZFL1_9PSEU